MKMCDNGLRFLVIGNSISLHGKCGYWFNRCGMAATDIEMDYVHILQNKFSQSVPTEFCVHNLVAFETSWYDRAESFSQLEPYFRRKFDLVIIQLGENIYITDNLKEDFISLVDYIRTNTDDSIPIVIIGNFWKNIEVDRVKKSYK